MIGAALGMVREEERPWRAQLGFELALIRSCACMCAFSRLNIVPNLAMVCQLLFLLVAKSVEVEEMEAQEAMRRES